jgi:hypothetical protein
MPASSNASMPMGLRFKSLLGRLRHEQAALGCRPDPLRPVHNQGGWEFSRKSLIFPEPLDLAGARVEAADTVAFRPEPEAAAAIRTHRVHWDSANRRLPPPQPPVSDLATP